IKKSIIQIIPLFFIIFPPFTKRKTIRICLLVYPKKKTKGSDSYVNYLWQLYDFFMIFLLLSSL
ncbi:hypothetical protein A7K93_11390, partial [Candidatus Methylacidiphilum fumarolicum]|uniref:hypothetical protein n=1 Tax=Candidatus Methylacidiphilum fumarolicum TaxID=591154 RepID=UPI001104A6B8